MEAGDIKRVIVVFKTHLDIGFTGLAAEVLKTYRESYIPAALELAAMVNTPGQMRFVWTVGAYMAAHYLAAATREERRRFEEAVRLGYVRWHALPCTTHTELMDAELFRYGLSLSRRLDREFGMTTVAAKLTDVPGHTIAMVPLLAEAGVEYLHIGVNEASRMPGVPPLFRWQRDGAEVVVNYAGAYGQPTWLENGVALEFAHSGDNMGPPGEDDLDAMYEGLRRKYPNADIAAGTLEDFAKALRAVRGRLPMVTEEIGDSWIHGVASDPLKTSRFKRLLRLKNEWLAKGLLPRNSEEYGAFMEPMLLVAEHTWGMDVKANLMDFTSWEKADLQRARMLDATDPSLYGARNRHLAEALRAGLEQQPDRGPANLVSSYSRFEASHAEQRAYLDQALSALPEQLQAEAQKALKVEHPAANFTPVGTTDLDVPLQIADWTVTVGKDGQLTRVENPAQGLDRQVEIGLFEYQVFGGQTVDRCLHDYARDLDRHFYWAEPDFGKPGLKYCRSVEDKTWRMAPTALFAEGNRLLIQMSAPPEASEAYGCPRRVSILHRFEGGGIFTSLYWADKDACRVPEAVWFGFNLNCANPNRWRMQKMGESLSPLDVVKGGSRRMHCVERLLYSAADGAAAITPVDSPLVCIGGKGLYDGGTGFGRLEDGFAFLLCNNRWGTNFKQWFEDDMRFYFKTEFVVTETF